MSDRTETDLPANDSLGNESGNATPAGKVMLYVKNEHNLW